ncbi:hypothetical protein Q5H93_17630 [Hymenobacter sp. ASUV-10]|uniref:DUF4253 domain-containing protein n=1 Tax=Hymenobacter aranciens TaxID=3063996 RepID=A0ABT9BE77_9BACT|nr:hypothetical protein [Hymenobacter sp. ASUV-10]MDO7876570.1 hypothetical protein [Hymenobacter sp. ASUV-10]
MSDISEEGWCAEWLDGLEHVLWHIVQTGPAKYGRTFVDEQQIQQLKELSELTGGWIIFDDETEETAISLAEWQKVFQGDKLADYWFYP